MPSHDPAARRKMVTRGDERGGWLYVPFEQLERAGIADSPRDRPLYYRTWERPGRKSLVVSLYREA